jgi:hypothetical protein
MGCGSSSSAKPISDEPAQNATIVEQLDPSNDNAKHTDAQELESKDSVPESLEASAPKSTELPST